MNDLSEEFPFKRIACLNSWRSEAAEGSGTAVAIAGLETGLREMGFHIERVLPAFGSTDALSGRLYYNLLLARKADLSRFDLVAGFDMDGFLAPVEGPSYCVCLKGVAFDEARFERGLSRLKLQFLARLEKRNVSRAGKVVVTSRYCREVACRAYAIAKENVIVVPECIELEGNGERFTPSPRGSGGDFTILNVARQYRRKDTQTLLRAFEVLRGRRLPRRVRLRVVGGGPELKRLERLASRLELSDSVRFLGPLPTEKEVGREYRRADLFCLPSRQEGFGIVFLEAMKAGLPIVAARAGASPEVVPEGEAGLFFEPGDHRELADILEYLAWNQPRRESLARAGRRRVRRFERSRVAEEFVRSVLPESLSAGSGSSPPSPASNSLRSRKAIC